MAYPYFSNNQRKQLILHTLRTTFHYAPIQQSQADEFGWAKYYAPAVLTLSNLETYFGEASFAQTLSILTQRKADSVALAEGLFRTAFPADQTFTSKDGIKLLRGKQLFARLHDYRRYYPEHTPVFWPLVGVDGSRSGLLEKEQTAPASTYDLHLLYTQNRAFINNESAPSEAQHFEPDEVVEDRFRDAVKQVKSGKINKHKPIYDWRAHINRSLANFDELAYNGFSTTIHVDPDWTKFSELRQNYLTNLKSVDELRKIGLIQGSESVEKAAFVVKSRLQYFNGRYAQHVDAEDYSNDEAFVAIVKDIAITQWQIATKDTEDTQPSIEQLQAEVNKLNARKREQALQCYIVQKYATDEDKARQLNTSNYGLRLRREFHFCSLTTPIDLTPHPAAVDYSIFRLTSTESGLSQQDELTAIGRCEIYALDNHGVLLPRIRLESLIEKDFKIQTGRSTIEQLDEELDRITTAITGGQFTTLAELHRSGISPLEARVWGLAIRTLIANPELQDDQTLHTGAADRTDQDADHTDQDDMGGAKPARYGQYGVWDPNLPPKDLPVPSQGKSQSVDLSTTGSVNFLEYKAMHKRFTPQDLPPKDAILSDADAYDLFYLAHIQKKIPVGLLGDMWKATYTTEGFPHRHRKQLGMPAIVWSPRFNKYTYPCIYGTYTFYGGGHFLKLFSERQDILDDTSDSSGARDWQRPGANPMSNPPQQVSYTKAKAANTPLIASDSAIEVDLNAIMWPTHFDHQRTSKRWIEHLARIGSNLAAVPGRLFLDYQANKDSLNYFDRERLHPEEEGENMEDSDYETESPYPAAIHKSYFPIRLDNVGRFHAASTTTPAPPAQPMGPPPTPTTEGSNGQRLGRPRGLNPDGSTNPQFGNLQATHSSIAGAHSVGLNLPGSHSAGLNLSGSFVPTGSPSSTSGLFGRAPEMRTNSGFRMSSGGSSLFAQGQTSFPTSGNLFGQGQTSGNMFGQAASPSSTPTAYRFGQFDSNTPAGSPSLQRQPSPFVQQQASPFVPQQTAPPFVQQHQFQNSSQQHSAQQSQNQVNQHVLGIDAARQAEGQANDLFHLSQMSARQMENASYQQFLAAHARTSEINLMADMLRRLQAERDLNEGNMHAMFRTAMAARRYGMRAGDAIAGAVYAGVPIQLDNLRPLTAEQIQIVSAASINDYNDSLLNDWLAAVTQQAHTLDNDYATLPVNNYTAVAHRTQTPAATDDQLIALDKRLSDTFDDPTRPPNHNRGQLLTMAYPEAWRGVPQPTRNVDLSQGALFTAPQASPLARQSPRTSVSSSKRKAADAGEGLEEEDDSQDSDIPDAIPAKAKAQDGTPKKAPAKKTRKDKTKQEGLGTPIKSGPIRLDSEEPAPSPSGPQSGRSTKGSGSKKKGKGNSDVLL
ncbi:hypothetical protein LTR81_003723 [Elasticomyces elasticus]